MVTLWNSATEPSRVENPPDGRVVKAWQTDSKMGIPPSPQSSSTSASVSAV